jgi:hypothetical protein
MRNRKAKCDQSRDVQLQNLRVGLELSPRKIEAATRFNAIAYAYEYN